MGCIHGASLNATYPGDMSYDMCRGMAWPPARRGSSATGWAAPLRRRCQGSPSPSAPWVTREGPCPGITGLLCCCAAQPPRPSARSPRLRCCRACQGMPGLHALNACSLFLNALLRTCGYVVSKATKT